MQISREDLVYSKVVIEFVAVAGEYCSFLEQTGGFAKKDFVDKSRKILPLLYYKAVLIPPTEPFFEEGTERFVTEEEWYTIHDSIRTRLGSHDDYPEIFDPVARDTDDRVGGSIAENMADIYQDVKDFVMVYRMGTVELMNDALWECMQHFDQSWGQKLLNGLRALHNLIHGEKNLDDDDENDQEQNKGKRDTDNWIFTRRQKLWNKDDEG